jgi:hypothetical protein
MGFFLLAVQPLAMSTALILQQGSAQQLKGVTGLGALPSCHGFWLRKDP